MLPQYGGTPNYKQRLPSLFLIMLALVLITGILLALSFYLYSDPVVREVQNRIRLTLFITVLLSVMILLVATSRWWHRHLWHRRNVRKHRRHKRSGRRTSSRHRHS